MQSAAESGECWQTGHVVARTDWPGRVSYCTAHSKRVEFTAIANRLVAAGKAKGVDSKLAADCAAKLNRNIVQRERAAKILVSVKESQE